MATQKSHSHRPALLKPLTQNSILAFKFFRGKQHGPTEVICPKCHHRQAEPPLAVSTFCRKCNTHFKIENGKAVAQPDPYKNKDRSVSALNSPASDRIKPPQGDADPNGPKTSTSPKQAPALKPKKNSLFQKNKTELREIFCFNCKASLKISPSSTSTLCAKCSSYISLKNFDIRERWSRRIQTRGDVFIHKKGTVAGTTIQCHDLTVEGDFTGGAECSGDLIIRRNGKIIGKVICRRLIIEKRAKVEFLNTVETSECKIDGLVTGNIICSGRLALEKKAILTGNIKVGRLTISEGAKHQGQIQMGRL